MSFEIWWEAFWFWSSVPLGLLSISPLPYHLSLSFHSQSERTNMSKIEIRPSGWNESKQENNIIGSRLHDVLGPFYQSNLWKTNLQFMCSRLITSLSDVRLHMTLIANRYHGEIDIPNLTVSHIVSVRYKAKCIKPHNHQLSLSKHFSLKWVIFLKYLFGRLVDALCRRVITNTDKISNPITCEIHQGFLNNWFKFWVFLRPFLQSILSHLFHLSHPV